MSVWRLLTFRPEDGERIVAAAQAWVASNNANYGHGSFRQAMGEHWRETVHLYTDPRSLRRLVGFLSQIFATMIIGLVLGRRQFFQHAEHYLPLVRKAQWWLLAAGLATGAVFATWAQTTTDFVTPSPFRIFAGLCYWSCRIFVMLFYVATIVRCVHNVSIRPKLQIMATAGRMPLTNYLMQTLIATTIFYGWGFAQWGKVGLAIDLVLSIGIFFAVQVPLSGWWLKRYEMGPMEFLWRKLTYGHAKMRRAPAAGAPA
jgi:uncharacterized protein